MRLTDVVDVLDARRVPVKASERAARGGRVPYYGATGQAGSIDSAIFDEPLVLLGEDGVPFFDPYKPKAYLVDGPAWVNNHAHVLRARAPVDRRFLKHYLDWFDYRGYANGTTRLKLTQSAMKRMPVLLPEPAEQRQIVEILEDHLSRLDAAADYASAARRRLRAMQKATLLELIPDRANYPSEWRTATVAEAGKVELGRQRHPDWHTGPNMQPYLRVANVFEDRIDTADVKEMHWDGDAFERFRLHPGDVLLNEGQTPDLLGRPALYRGEPPNVAFTNSLIRFKASPDVLPEFALLVFRRHMHAGRFTRESRITTNIAHLSAARLKPIEFPIPSLEAQTAIVQDASTRLADIARLEGTISSQTARAHNLRRAVLAAAFSGKLTGRRSDDEVVEELAGALA
ncbi:restriction endonuclease subunit S [Yimella sp. cx-51]|uniref:restriction endonuclease subunit S n=1 Tax=Yimella sp. cx-51 TaxID=2770551 RepID=UPI00165DCC70|nr:restriction endonuclease subunit S [Yimella sp. cx-51]MBC9956445.1 restriction endonuclease subunit S [Yimella sp. cx-51]QTH38439.1 restriction endonuclease subunit S [Yimella sp. cx-51]